MAPALESHLVARDRVISHGSVAGVVIGCVAGLIVLILIFPFILRFFRTRRRKAAAQNVPPMGMVCPPGPVGHYPPPQQQPPYPYYSSPPVPGPHIYDHGSWEEGKAYESHSPQAGTPAASAAPGGQPRSALPPGTAAINTSVPSYPSPPSAGFTPQQYPSPGPGSGPGSAYSTPITQQQRSPTLQSAAPSLAQTVASFFSHRNTQSTLSRSSTAARSTAEATRSPVDEYSLGNFNASNHMWPGPPGPIPPTMAGHPRPATTGMYEPNHQYLTGSSAEYYSASLAECNAAGAPMSPPSDAGPAAQSQSQAASSAQLPALPGLFATNLLSMSSMNAAAAIPLSAPSGAAKDPKLTAIHTYSKRSDTPGTDFSPLSPTSPPRGQDGERGMVKDKEGSVEPSEAAAKASTSASASLSPEPVSFCQLSPSFRPLVPSPRLPAPGTVNPRDVWAPGTEDERFVHVTAELDRIEQSPPPLALPNAATMADSEPSDPVESSPGEEYEQPATSPVADTSSTSDFEGAIVKTETPSATNFVDFAGKEDVDRAQTVGQTSQFNDGMLSPAGMEHTQQTSESLLMTPYGSVPMVSVPMPQQDEFSRVELATPETATTTSTGSLSPAQPYLFPPYQSIPTMVPNGMGTVPAPVTPPQPLIGAQSFDMPLAVPGIEQRPVSPMSNGSTPSRLPPSPQVYVCEKCGRMFDHIHQLNHHKRYHERPHMCAYPNCGMRFGTRTHLDRHVNDKHRKTRRYHCKVDDCAFSVRGGRSFPRKDNWRRHMVKKHADQPVCEPIEVVDQPMTDAGPAY